MTKLKLVAIIASIALVTGLFIGNSTSAALHQCDNDPPSGISNGATWLEVWAAICDLQTQIDTIEGGDVTDVCPPERVQHWDKILFKINDANAHGISLAVFENNLIFLRDSFAQPPEVDHTLEVKLLDRPNIEFNLNQKVIDAVNLQGGIVVVIGEFPKGAAPEDIIIIDAKYEIVCAKQSATEEGVGCPVSNIEHWDKILYFKDRSGQTYEIKLLDIPDRVFDLDARVGSTGSVDVVQIIDAKYEIVCVASP